MSTQFQLRRGTAAQNATFTGALGEAIVTIDDQLLHVHDGVTPGGWVVQTALAQRLLQWAYSQTFQLVSATRDINEAIIAASIVWPDGSTGTFTTDIASTSFPGAIDAWHATHVLNGVTKTVTQTAVTRDINGAVTAQPAITIA